MGYYVQHKIFLKDNSREKLELLQNLLEQYFCRLDIENNTVYDDDGEPMEMLCLSDAQWNFGSGTTWYTFDMNVADVSVTFNEKYPNETIYVYTKSEEGHEETYRFADGGCRSDKVTHYRQELEKACEQLNADKIEACGGLYNVQMVEGYPTIRFRDGAYTMIDWNYFELYWQGLSKGYSTKAPETMCHSSRNYSSLEDRSRAMKLLYDYIVEHRSEF